MKALFLQPLRNLQLRLRRCQPLTFVVDVLDECISEPEFTDLIFSLAQLLRDPNLPVTHILFTSRSETHISKAFQNEEVRTLLCEIPVKTSEEGFVSHLIYHYIKCCMDKEYCRRAVCLIDKCAWYV
jgi:hypothetical protein